MSHTAMKVTFRYCAISICCALASFPLYWIFITSVLPPNDILRYPPSFLPTDAQFEAYREVILERPLLKWIFNSAFIVCTSTTISVVVSVLAGYSLSRFRSNFSDMIGYGLLATRMIPSTFLVIPLYLIFKTLGMFDTYLALIIAYTTFEIPFATWMMRGYFDSIPIELEHAALVDGCSEIGALVRVILPLSAPGIAATIIASSILGWSDYVFARTLISDQSLWTITVGIHSFFGEHVIHWNHVMAGSLISILPMLLLFFGLERYLVMGLTAGAIK